MQRREGWGGPHVQRGVGWEGPSVQGVGRITCAGGGEAACAEAGRRGRAACVLLALQGRGVRGLSFERLLRDLDIFTSCATAFWFLRVHN